MSEVIPILCQNHKQNKQIQMVADAQVSACGLSSHSTLLHPSHLESPRMTLLFDPGDELCLKQG